MARQLKVFSTPAGFVNAVVAAPSQKAALEAWGIRENVFASGRASVVTDPELVARALETPGRIVRVPIGSDEAILQGAKPPPPPSAEAMATKPEGTAKSAKTAKSAALRRPPPSPPDRTEVTAAERALVAVETRKAEELERLDDELRALQAERREREAALEREVASARSKRDAAAQSYRATGGSDGPGR